MVALTQLKQTRREQKRQDTAIRVVAVLENETVLVDHYRNQHLALRDILEHFGEGEEKAFLIQDCWGHVLATVLRVGDLPVTIHADGRVVAH